MKRKTNKDKGFTLVELIVVLVILAILAAILVPALLGYIDRAREKQYVLNAKSALTATQAELSSLYGEGKTDFKDATTGKFIRSDVVKNTADTPKDTEFYVWLCENKTTTDETGAETTLGAVAGNHNRYTVKAAYYVEKGYYCVFDGSTWTTSQKAPTAAPTLPSDADYELETTALQIY